MPLTPRWSYGYYDAATNPDGQKGVGSDFQGLRAMFNCPQVDFVVTTESPSRTILVIRASCHDHQQFDRAILQATGKHVGMKP